MQTRALIASVAALLFAAPAAAQMTSTIDDSVAALPAAPPTPLSEGTGDAFGGQIGAFSGRTVEITWDSDVLGSLSFRMETAACGTADQDVIVIYVDSVASSGFSDTTGFTDNFSVEARAVSALGSPLTFPTGFEADFAIAIQNNMSDPKAFVYRLVAGSGHVARSLAVTTGASGCQDFSITDLTLADLGLQQGDSMRWFATVLNGNDGFRANEFHGVAGPGSNIGINPFTMAADDYNEFRTIGPLVINEVNAQSPGSPDTEEFIELFGPPDARLDGVTLVAFNGSTDLSYDLGGFASGIDLDGRTMDGNGFFVVGSNSTSPDITMDDNSLQQGADAVALYFGDGADWPKDTAVTDVLLIDALVYDNGHPDDSGLLSVLTPGQPQLNEDIGPFGGDVASNQRCPDGAGGPLVTTEYNQSTTSPGEPNACVFCGNGTVESGEACDDGDDNGAATSCCLMNCSPRTAGISCGPSTGTDCDLADSCDAIGNCVDNVVAGGTECRAAVAGGCDVAESCDGVSRDCPADAVEPMDTECNAAGGTCDVAEVCDGTSPSCPADVLMSAGEVCRAGVGCDAEEVCDGSSVLCPTDVLAAAGTVCRAGSPGTCNTDEVCDGSSDVCPADGPAAAGVVCRAANASGCDAPEVCDGSSMACPSDGVATSGTVCRAAAGTCDTEETCDGSSDVCPSDMLLASGTECRASTSSCDPAELCDGSAVLCPADDTIADCCVMDADCDDGDVCTTDSCVTSSSTCTNAPIDGCGTPDAGPDDDAGPPADDAGSSEDAGGAGADAGTGTGDAGIGVDAGDGEDGGGCSCQAPGGVGGSTPLWLLAPLALLFRRRRAR